MIFVNPIVMRGWDVRKKIFNFYAQGKLKNFMQWKSGGTAVETHTPSYRVNEARLSRHDPNLDFYDDLLLLFYRIVTRFSKKLQITEITPCTKFQWNGVFWTEFRIFFFWKLKSRNFKNRMLNWRIGNKKNTFSDLKNIFTKKCHWLRHHLTYFAKVMILPPRLR